MNFFYKEHFYSLECTVFIIYDFTFMFASFPTANGVNADFTLQGQFSNNFPMDIPLPSFGYTFDNQFSVSSSK